MGSGNSIQLGIFNLLGGKIGKGRMGGGAGVGKFKLSSKEWSNLKRLPKISVAVFLWKHDDDYGRWLIISYLNFSGNWSLNMVGWLRNKPALYWRKSLKYCPMHLTLVYYLLNSTISSSALNCLFPMQLTKVTCSNISNKCFNYLSRASR